MIGVQHAAPLQRNRGTSFCFALELNGNGGPKAGSKYKNKGK